jgi:hypothetical protein
MSVCAATAPQTTRPSPWPVLARARRAPIGRIEVEKATRLVRIPLTRNGVWNPQADLALIPARQEFDRLRSASVMFVVIRRMQRVRRS